MTEIVPFGQSIDIGEQHYHELLLEKAKLEFREMAVKNADLIYIGELRAGTPSQDWMGKISLAERLKSGDITEAKVEEATSSLNESFVPVAEGAPKRCVDGSTIVGYDDKDPDWYGRPLGPQVQGGTSGDASGVRLAKGYQQGSTFEDDVKNQLDVSSRFAPGDHTDDHAKGQNTGCGQIDGHERRSAIYANDKIDTLVDVLKTVYTKAGAVFPEEKVESLKSNGKSIYQHAKDYYGDGTKILKLLRDINPKSVEKLKRPHAEVSLTINCVANTTFHRDHYNAKTQSKIQNFNLDAWNIIEEHGEDAFFVLADAVATLMDLTDGSLRVYIRLPKSEKPELTSA